MNCQEIFWRDALLPKDYKGEKKIGYNLRSSSSASKELYKYFSHYYDNQHRIALRGKDIVGANYIFFVKKCFEFFFSMMHPRLLRTDPLLHLLEYGPENIQYEILVLKNRIDKENVDVFRLFDVERNFNIGHCQCFFVQASRGPLLLMRFSKRFR